MNEMNGDDERGAMIILLPSHPDYPYRRILPPEDYAWTEDLESRAEQMDKKEMESLTEIPSPLSLEQERSPQLTRQELRDYMLAHSQKGRKVMPVRTKFVGETPVFDSPIDKKFKFGIRRVGVNDVISFRDSNSVVRFITEGDEENSRYVQERDYPSGTMVLDAVVVGLAHWNIEDTPGHTVEITRENINTYLDPEELDFIYDKVMEVNPILSNQSSKKKSRGTANTSDGSSSGGDDSSPIRKVLPITGSTLDDLQ